MTRQTIKRRLAALEAVQQEPEQVMTIGISLHDENGHLVGYIPPEPIPDWGLPGRRVDYRRSIAREVELCK